MADIVQAIEYAKQNPNSAFATELRGRIESGKLNKELEDAGLTKFISAPKEKKATIIDKAKADIKQRVANINEQIQDDKGNPVVRGFKAAAEGAQIVTDVLVKQPIAAVADKISDTKVAQRIAQNQKVGVLLDKIRDLPDEVIDRIGGIDLIEQAAQYPEQTKKLEDALSVFKSTGDIANVVLAAEGIRGSIQSSTRTVADTAGKVKDLFPKKGVSITPEVTAKYPTSIIETLQDKVTRLDPQVKNILEDAPIEKFDRYVSQGEKSIKDPRELTPLQQVNEFVDNQVLPNIKQDLSNIGSQKAKSLESVKNTQVKNATADAIAFINEKTKGLKLTPEESKIIAELKSQLELGTSPTLGTLDKTVDLLQSTLYEKGGMGSIPVTTRVESIVNQTIGKLNGTVKSAASKALGSDEYSVLNDSYAKKVDIFNRLNKAVGEDGSKGGTLFKKFFTAQDSSTKKLFKEILDEYGVDLAQDATLAKFVMDSLGDVRAKSFLDVPTSKAGLVEKGIEFVVDRTIGKLPDPIGKARRTIKKRDAAK